MVHRAIRITSTTYVKTLLRLPVTTTVAAPLTQNGDAHQQMIESTRMSGDTGQNSVSANIAKRLRQEVY